MRIRLAIGILIMTAAPGLAADTAGLPPEMWQRVRAAESAAIDLKPIPSPQAPASMSLQECISLAFRHNAGFRQDQERLINAQRGLWVADQRRFYTATGSAEEEKNPGGSAETALESAIATRWEQTDGGAIQANLGTGIQQGFGDLLTQRPALTLSYDRPLLRGVGLASSTAERIRSAKAALGTEELSYYDSYQQLAQSVIEGYFAVLLARGEVDIAKGAADRAQRLYEANYSKFTGESPSGKPEESVKVPGQEWVTQVAEIDVDQARFSWERARQSVISAQQAYQDATDRLLLAVGLTPGASPNLTTAISYSPQDYDAATLTQTAVANSTELGRLQFSRQDAQAALRIAHSQDLPDVIASVGVNDLGETLNGTTVSTGWFGAVRVEAPLWDRRRREDVHRAGRDLEVLDQRTIATRDSVAQGIQRLVRAADSARARITIGEQALALARKNREAAQVLYEEGITDYLRVLDADDRLVQAERSLLQEQVTYFLTTVEIRRAVGEDVTQGLPR